MSKKLVALLVITLCLLITACGGGDSGKKSSTSSQQTASERKPKYKSQDLNKIAPIAKLLKANESELREIEKVLSALDIDFNKINTFKKYDNDDYNVLRVGYTPQKGESLAGTKVLYPLILNFDINNKKLSAVGFDHGYNMYSVMYKNGTTYLTLSDLLITQEVKSKVEKDALQKIKDSEFGKKYSDINFDVSALDVKGFAKTHKDHSQIYSDKYYRVVDSVKWYKDIKIVPFIRAFVRAKAKEKYYGGENKVEINFTGIYDMEGTYVTSEKFGLYSSDDTTSRIYCNDNNINLGQTIEITSDDMSVLGNANNSKESQQSSQSSTSTDVSKTAPIDSNKSSSTSTTSESSITKNAIVSVKHSSVTNEDGNNHSGELTTDGDIKTCWVEGVPGLGIGESILYQFNGNYKVSGLNIWTGHQKSEDLFYKNARPTAIRVIGSDGSNVIYPLNDAMGMQRVTFNNPITVNIIKLVIEKVAPGNKYEDTCIAEVNFF